MSLRELVMSGEIRKHSAAARRQVVDLQYMMAEIGIDHLEGTLGWEKPYQYASEDEPYYDLDGYRFNLVKYRPEDKSFGYLRTRPICSTCRRPILFRRDANVWSTTKEDDLVHHVHNIEWLKKLLDRFPQPGWICPSCQTGQVS